MVQPIILTSLVRDLVPLPFPIFFDALVHQQNVFLSCPCTFPHTHSCGFHMLLLRHLSNTRHSLRKHQYNVHYILVSRFWSNILFSLIFSKIRMNTRHKSIYINIPTQTQRSVIKTSLSLLNRDLKQVRM